MASSNSVTKVQLSNAWRQLSKEGEELYKKKDFYAAEVKFKTAIDQFQSENLDDKAILLRNHARSCHQLKKWELAIDGYSQALKFQKDEAKKAEIKGKRKEAIQGALTKIHHLYEKENFKEAKIACKSVSNASDDLSKKEHCDFRRHYAWVLESLGQKAEAIAEYKQALQLAPDEKTSSEIKEEMESTENGDSSDEEATPPDMEKEDRQHFIPLSELLKRGAWTKNADGSVTFTAPIDESSVSKDTVADVADEIINPVNPFGFR